MCQEINKPYYTNTLNKLQVQGLTVMTVFISCRLIIRSMGIFNDGTEEIIVGTLSNEEISMSLEGVRRINVNYREDFAVFCVCAIFMLVYFAIQLSFVQSIYIHLLLYLIRADQNDKFKTLSCNRFKPRDFMALYSTQE